LANIVDAAAAAAAAAMVVVQVLYGLVGGVFASAMYSIKRVLLNNTAGS
jgi:nitrate/nitrite transporter NarK